MNILFLHPNMPGQYKHLARAFGAEGGHRIFFVTKHRTAEIPGVVRITYGMPKIEKVPDMHRYLRTTTFAILQGQYVWRVCKQLQEQENFTPDIIICHPGWGDALFLKDLFPKARILTFFEFYYHGTGADVGFEEPIGPDDMARVRFKNTTNLMSLEQADWGVSPTVWQWSLHPKEFQPKISVLHDGVDIDVCRPDGTASITLPNGRVFKAGDEVMTYIARNFEPYRGFETFMKAAEILLRDRPNLHIIAVGADSVSYGKRAPDGKTYRQVMSEQVSLPVDRIHFVGTVPYDDLIKLFQVSAAHLYLTYPFVLSWSMLEAMASGVALVASNTKPVLEIVQHEVNGLLADFFSPEDVAAKISQLLDDPSRNAAMRLAARSTVVQRFAVKDLLPLHMQLVREIAAGQIPPPVANQIQAVSPIAPYASAMWAA
ncbi:MAG: glycosyltransferase family 4 protein [Rickettsiales bacterium]